ncbi:DNA-binding transcriptional regulator [uncultured Tistrella sp.]|mgnify:CR=1 FL=1|jgi:putative transcriptional regulator|uniref:helix-turn-helix domain-containing protein n=1 Tax=Tistrella mobilis TaxID=171437 RepID=UPI000C0B5CF9|nr:DNA-binding transcriptional regulator [uncultured Tistrella sp.]MAM77209.1 transcriptional regulator [Tistrella sp.]|tara:strand:- start:184 stop:501 length:318 start_codon:yes stop_codon:yes gene_type:complete
MTKTYRSDALAAIHETASDLHDVGLLDKQTMRQFDALALAPVAPMRPDAIKALRQREKVSQAVFARYLNVTTGLISQWERGEKRPAGASLKLLSLVERHGLGVLA